MRVDGDRRERQAWRKTRDDGDGGDPPFVTGMYRSGGRRGRQPDPIRPVRGCAKRSRWCRSASRSASSNGEATSAPTSGLAASARNATSRSPVRAASMVSSSYAFTACTSPRCSGAKRREPKRVGAVAVDDRRNLDDRGVGQIRQCAPSLRTSTTWMSPGAVVQRGDELGRRLAVIGTAAVVEQLGLLGQRWVAVHLEQLAPRCPSRPGRACGRSAVRPTPCGSGSSSGCSTTGWPASSAACPRGIRSSSARSLASSSSRSRQAVLAVDADRPLPAQMVEPDVLELHALRLDTESCRDPALERDGNIAQAQGPMAVVDQCLGHDPDRVREVDDPSVLGGPTRGQLRELEDDAAPSAAPWRTPRHPSSPGR